MSLVNTIYKYAPNYWCPQDGAKKQLSTHSAEFQQIEFEVQEALSIPKGYTRRVSKIVRVQNKHDLGQCLVREQLLATANRDLTFYRVRRYTRLKLSYLERALKFNLDHRRCNLTNLVLRRSIPIQQVLPDEVVIIVQVVTAYPDDDISPNTTIEYFIDYVVYF